MVTVKLPVLNYEKNGVKIDSAKDILALYVDFPPEKGFTRNDMFIANEIARKLKTAKTTIELENQEYDYILAIDTRYPWAIRSEEIAAFREHLSKAREESKEVTSNPKKKK